MKPSPFANLHRRGALVALAALLTAGPASPARADWLVTREGARVETKGAWTVKGKLVVFKTADGKLSSLRVADVDLDASRRATEEALAAQAQAEAEPEKPPEPRKSVRVLTDKDFPSAAPAPAPAEQAEAEAGTEGKEKAPAAGPATGAGVVVETWNQERDPEEDYVIVTGTLQNASSATAADVKLKVMLFDADGALIATSQAALALGALPPGQKTKFKAEFPGYFSFVTLRFETESRRLATRPAGEPVPEAPPENGG